MTPPEASASTLNISSELAQDSPESKAPLLNISPTTAYDRYLGIGPLKDVGSESTAILESIEIALDNQRSDHQYARGWLLVEHSRLISDRNQKLTMIAAAGQAWEKCVQSRDYSMANQLRDRYRAVIAYSYLPLLYGETLNYQPNHPRHQYQSLVEILPIMEQDFRSYGDGSTEAADLAGLIQEVSVLTLFSRLRYRHSMPLLPWVSLPRQDFPPKKAAYTGGKKYIWDVTLHHEDIGRESLIQVKSKPIPSAKKVREIYHPDILVLFAPHELNNLNIDRNEDTRNIEFPMLKHLVQEAAGIKRSSVELDRISQKLLKLVHRQDLERKLRR